MRRLIVPFLLVGVTISYFGSALAMRKMSPDSVKAQLAAMAVSRIGKRQGSPSVTATQRTAIGRRISNLRTALERVRVSGKAQASFPAGLVDGILDWQRGDASDVELWWDSDTQTPYFIKGTDLVLPHNMSQVPYAQSAAASSAEGTFARAASLMRLRDPSVELRIISEQTDDLGMTHVTFQQTYRGYDIWARNLTAHFDATGRMTSIGGRWTQTPTSLDGRSVTVSRVRAEITALQHFQNRGLATAESAWVSIYVDTLQEPHLSWVVRVTNGQETAYDVFVDGVSGEVLHERPLVYNDGPIVGSGTDLTGASRTVYAYQQGTWYYMWNTTKYMFNPATFAGIIAIYDYGPTYNPAVRSTNVNSWPNAAAVSAAYNLGIVYDFYFSRHGRNSIDGLGGILRAIVNDQSAINNASFNRATQTMRFGLGGTAQFSNLAASLDVCGHEMTHGVIAATVGLEYEFQSGALDESFADAMGAMVESYALGVAGDWLMGEDVTTPGISGDALRDMEDPASNKVCAVYCAPQPTQMSEYQFLPYSEDYGGVHINSGIPNRAFYLIASSIGRGKADSIYYRVLAQRYLASYSQFVDLRLAVLESASDLYPGNSAISSAIASAFNTVGILSGSGSQPPGDLPSPTSTQWIVARDELNGRAARFGTDGTFIQYISTAGVASKPSAPDSADVVFFVDNTSNITAVDRYGTWQIQLGDPTVEFNSVAVSPDGKYLAYFVKYDPTLYVYNLATGHDELAWPLYTPTNTSYNSYDVLYPDVLEWTIEGSRIVYDCLCFLPIGADTLFYWDIRTLDVSTGLISRTIPSLPVGFQIGDPSLGRVHPDLMVFDYFDGDSVAIWAANLSDNSFGLVAYNGIGQGRPSFAPNDQAVVFQFYNGSGWDLWERAFDPVANLGVGPFLQVTTSATYPNWRFEGRAEPTCYCPCADNPQCDPTGIINVQDIVQTVNVAFRGAPPVFDYGCPTERTDVDANGFTNVVDITKVVNVAFRGQTAAANFVNPCGH